MNREIKFRGHNGEKWVYGSLVNNLWVFDNHETILKGIPVCEIITGDYKGDCWEDVAVGQPDSIVGVNPDSVGQYTGLLDKNKNEIYEGDIVLVYDYEARVVEFKNAFWQLELCENATNLGGFGTPVEAGHKPIYRYPKEWIEVIGNVFQNPELIPKP